MPTTGTFIACASRMTFGLFSTHSDGMTTTSVPASTSQAPPAAYSPSHRASGSAPPSCESSAEGLFTGRRAVEGQPAPARAREP